MAEQVLQAETAGLADGSLSKSALGVYNILKKGDGLTPKELIALAGYSPRTVRYAIREMETRRLIVKVPNLFDVRQRLIYLRPAGKINFGYRG